MQKEFKNWYLIPFVFILALPLLIHSFIYDGSRLFTSFIITLIIPIVTRIIFNIKPFLFIILSFPLLLLALMYDTMVLEYDSYININTWNAIFNTNPAEATELSSEIRLITKLLALFQVLTYIIYLFFTYKKSIKKVKTKFKYVIVGFLFMLVIDYQVRGATKFSFPIWSLSSLYDYYKVKKQEARYYEIKKNAVFNAVRNAEYDENTKETIIVVVGETLRRDHLEYYGYQKPTSPLMKKEDLLIFTDVVSAANQTVNSLQRAFTLAENLDENYYWKYPSLIRSFKEVGFKTYWLSTQLVYDKNSNEVSFIAQECDSIINYNMESYDEKIIEPLDNVLKINDQKKIIFLHILGSHSTYNKRYPKSYTYFSKIKSKDKKVNIMREYDDAVRYNDFILSQFLDKLKKQEGERSFMMFSDHGESLYDSKPNYFNHGSDKPSQSEFNIPLILWFSDEFKDKHGDLMHQITANKDKPIVLSDFFYALPSFYGIEFDKLKPANNFFGKEYISKKNRKVMNGSSQLLEYDKLKSTHAKIDY